MSPAKISGCVVIQFWVKYPFDGSIFESAYKEGENSAEKSKLSLRPRLHINLSWFHSMQGCMRVIPITQIEVEHPKLSRGQPRVSHTSWSIFSILPWWHNRTDHCGLPQETEGRGRYSDSPTTRVTLPINYVNAYHYDGDTKKKDVQYVSMLNTCY